MFADCSHMFACCSGMVANVTCSMLSFSPSGFQISIWRRRLLPDHVKMVQVITICIIVIIVPGGFFIKSFVKILRQCGWIRANGGELIIKYDMKLGGYMHCIGIVNDGYINRMNQ